MRLDFAVIALSLLTSASAAAIGEPLNIARVDVQEHDLFKRKGGGGGGGRGGGSSSGGRGGSSSGSGSSSSGSSGSSGGRGGSSSSGSGSSGSSGSSGNRGGSGSGSSSSSGNRGGSVPQPRYGGGQYYAGGSKTPYSAGRSSRPGGGGIVPGLLIGGALAFWPGLWLSGAYMYNYHDPYRFRNASNNNKEESLPIICGCAQNAECGCDENGNNTNIDELVGNGSYANLNKSVINVGTKDGRKVLLINGTIENTDGNSNTASSAAVKTVLETIGFWPVVATVAAIVFAA
ncbi:hypothetical protein PWT90_06892 [Aphanocladium album]|nr:hypothetical protein PWT90_06892 [Aphanocladium album]